MHLPRVGVLPANQFSAHRRLLHLLGQLFSVEIVSGQAAGAESCEAVLLFDSIRAEAVRLARAGLHCLAYVKGQSLPRQSRSADLSLGPSTHLVESFRGRTLFGTVMDRAYPLEVEPGDEVLARIDRDVLWVRRTEGTSDLHLVAIGPPALPDKDYLFQYLQSDCWVKLLPILNFLRVISGWEPPPVRACFMFDDPNLHWKGYGYIKYDLLAQHAREHHYHVSFAMVPLDAWFTHHRTAALFRENKHLLSLLVHGNNHTHKELAISYSEQRRCALVAQALMRIERFERVSGLEVSRVMATPHHACTDEMAGTLVRMGFEAACISRAFMMENNGDKAWPDTIGLNPVEFLAGSLPVIPRFNFGLSSPRRILLAAFFGQAIVPVGHHEDLADGMDLLKKLADLINATVDVQWTDMMSIARSNFCSRRDGKVLRLKLFSRHIRLTVPADITEICVERPWLKAHNAEALSWRQGQSRVQASSLYQAEPIPTHPGADVEICSIHPDLVDPRKLPLHRTPLWMVGRRQLCEGRDRLKPAMDRLLSFRSKRNA